MTKLAESEGIAVSVPKKLFVLIHGYNTTGAASLKYIKRTVVEIEPDAEFYIPSLPFSHFSLVNLNEVVLKLLNVMDQKWKEQTHKNSSGYEEIVIIGHSLGALVARKLYVCACGENPKALFENGLVGTGVAAWASKVSRLILLAGMNRGWTISHHLSFKNAILWSIGNFFSILCKLVTGKKTLISQVKRGAPFITQLRMQWLAMEDNIQTKKVGGALTVQLLGTVDDIVSPEDSIDLVTGERFVYIDIPKTNHATVVNLDGSEAGKERKDIFHKALTYNSKQLKEVEVRMDEVMPRPKQPEVTDVVFVLHGIRDKGYWAGRIARKARTLGEEMGKDRRHDEEKEIKYATETSSYGYFPMLPFLLPWVRRKKVEWFMDQYTENMAIYPNAKFSFFGHSNGTYLLAKAMEEYPACMFKNVVFAGSVVRRNFDWAGLLNSGRIESIVNFVASADWVVAIFPKTFQTLRIQDLGSGGHDGFRTLTFDKNEVKYVKGNHGAALREDLWDFISYSIVYGKLKDLPPEYEVSKQPLFFKILGYLAPMIFTLGLAIITWIGYFIWGHICDETLRVIATFFYGWILWTIVTRL